MNWRLIAYVDGIVLVITGLFMMVPVAASIFYNGTDLIPLLITSALTFGTGLALVIPNRKCRKEDLRHRDGFFSVTSSWLLVSLFGALPYLLAGTFGGFTDAFFESMAGLTTTGASVLTDIESQQHGIRISSRSSTESFYGAACPSGWEAWGLYFSLWRSCRCSVQAGCSYSRPKYLKYLSTS